MTDYDHEPTRFSGLVYHGRQLLLGSKTENRSNPVSVMISEYAASVGTSELDLTSDLAMAVEAELLKYGDVEALI